MCLAALSLGFHCCSPHFQYVVEKEGLEGIVVSGSIKVDRRQTQCLVKSFFKNWRKCLQDSWEVTSCAASLACSRGFVACCVCGGSKE